MSANAAPLSVSRSSTPVEVSDRRFIWGAAILGVVVALATTITFATWSRHQHASGVASGNGRVEATAIDIAAKTPGRIAEIVVREGEIVEQGEVIAVMDNSELEAELAKARAAADQAFGAHEAAVAVIGQRQQALATAEALLTQRRSDLELARRQFGRSSELMRDGSISKEALDIDETRFAGARAAVDGAETSMVEAKSAIAVAQAQADAAFAGREGALAEVLRLATVIYDNFLRAPCRGRVQYHIAQIGEVVSAGAPIANLIDLSDVYMTFFLPEAAAGAVGIGSEARIVLDAMPETVLPAHVSFVASVAQFTPKTVETANEREKLMFRVKARLDVERLGRIVDTLKTGVPGIAYVRVQPNAAWPERLASVVGAPAE